MQGHYSTDSQVLPVSVEVLKLLMPTVKRYCAPFNHIKSVVTLALRSGSIVTNEG